MNHVREKSPEPMPLSSSPPSQSTSGLSAADDLPENSSRPGTSDSASKEQVEELSNDDLEAVVGGLSRARRPPNAS